MLSPFDWEIALHREKRWGEAYPVVEREARAYLQTLADGASISTNALVEALYPIAAVRGEGQGRARIYDALRAMKNGQPSLLSDCRVRGELKKMRGGIKVRPWLWHKPTPKPKRTVICPNCLQEHEIDGDVP